eukprot:4070170-Alexandrium_andersonii.AAC.1
MWPAERPPAHDTMPKGLANSGLCPQLFPGPGARWWPFLEVEGAKWPEMSEEEMVGWTSLFGPEVSAVSLQQLLEAIQGSDDSEVMPPMKAVVGSPPSQANAYSDGSVAPRGDLSRSKA